MNKKFLFIGGTAIALCFVSYLAGAKMNKPVPKLADGKELVITIDGLEVTAEDFYAELKEKNGIDTLINTMIDNFIANKEVEETAEIKDSAKSQVEMSKYYAEQSGTDWITYINQYGYKDEAAVYDYFLSEVKKEATAKNFIKESITNEEVEDYYNENIFGEITAKHILITPEVDSDMTTAEKTAAKEKALATAKEVITKLEDGEEWNDLVQEYTDDTASKADNGELTFDKQGVVPEFWNGANSLEDGKYTKTPVESDYGYHIIYRVSQEERPTLVESTETVLDSLVTKKIGANANLIKQTWIKIREEYKITINDPKIKELYENFVDNLK